MVRQSRQRRSADSIVSLMGRIYDHCLFYGRRIEEAKLNKGKKKKTEKKHDEDEDKIPGSVKEHSRVGLRQYARGRAYDPYRYSEEGPTAYPRRGPHLPAPDLTPAR